MFNKHMKQIGVIVCGGGIDYRAWIDAEKAAGRIIRLCNGYCEIYAAK